MEKYKSAFTKTMGLRQEANSHDIFLLQRAQKYIKRLPGFQA